MSAVLPLPRICVALGCSDRGRLEKLALNACDNGEEFLEIRLDLLDNPQTGIPVMRRIHRRYPDTVLLATCRRKPNGGGFAGTVEEEMEILEKAVTAGASLVDVEIETTEDAPHLVEQIRQRTRLVVSHHDFEGTPALSRLTARLCKVPADIYKIAATARKPSDNLRILEAPAICPSKVMVALAMGEVGIPSRILGLSRNMLFGFASPDPIANDKTKRSAKPLSGEPTAPGQITASKLRTCYQAHKRTAATKIYGVIADPVAHSMSPALHNRAFRSRRLDSVYLPFRVEKTKLGDFFEVVEKLPVAGFSVTIPHKQSVVRYLDSVDSLARRAGAVNTVFRRRGRLCGTNTDVIGVTAPLEKKIKLNQANVLIAGNGGAARGATAALLEKGARITLTGRNPHRVRSLARACDVDAIDRAAAERQHFDVFIHATPLGMEPDVDGCFFAEDIPADIVFDMVYNPLETRLIQNARAQGKDTITGLEMFLEQAAAQFAIWTGENPPRTVIRNAVLEELASRSC